MDSSRVPASSSPESVTGVPLGGAELSGKEKALRAAKLTYKVLNDDVERETRIKRLRYLARWMDSSVRLPGSKFSVGWDPIIGMIPVAGDVVSLALNLYILYEARRMKASIGQLARIIVNIVLDFGIGSIPIAGDAFDFAFKCAERNLRILGIEPLPGAETVVDGAAGNQGEPTRRVANLASEQPPPLPRVNS